MHLVGRVLGQGVLPVDADRSLERLMSLSAALWGVPPRARLHTMGRRSGGDRVQTGRSGAFEGLIRSGRSCAPATEAGSVEGGEIRRNLLSPAGLLESSGVGDIKAAP